MPSPGPPRDDPLPGWGFRSWENPWSPHGYSSLRIESTAWSSVPSSAQPGQLPPQPSKVHGETRGVGAGDPSAPLGGLGPHGQLTFSSLCRVWQKQRLTTGIPGEGHPCPPQVCAQTLGCLLGLPCHPACSFRAGVYYISRGQSSDPSRSLTEQGGFREAGVVPVDSLASSSPCPLSGFQGVRLALPSPPSPALTQPGTHFRSVCRQMSDRGHREARVTQLAGS